MSFPVYSRIITEVVPIDQDSKASFINGFDAYNNFILRMRVPQHEVTFAMGSDNQIQQGQVSIPSMESIHLQLQNHTEKNISFETIPVSGGIKSASSFKIEHDGTYLINYNLRGAASEAKCTSPLLIELKRRRKNIDIVLQNVSMSIAVCIKGRLYNFLPINNTIIVELKEGDYIFWALTNKSCNDQNLVFDATIPNGTNVASVTLNRI